MDERESSSGGGGETSLAEGTARMKEGRFSEAAAALRRAVEENPADETGWRLLGGALASAGDPEGAVAAFEQAVALAPASARNHYNLAVGLQATGRDAEAINHLEQALALDPNYQQARAALESLRGGQNEAADDSPDASAQTEPPKPRLAPLSSEPEHFAPSTTSAAAGEEPVLAAPPYNTPPLPVMGQAAYAPPVNGTLILILGIISLAGGCSCFLPGLLGPVAWVMANNALRTLDMPGVDQTQRGSVVAGRVCGIIGTVIFVLFLLYFVLAVGLGIAGALD